MNIVVTGGAGFIGSAVVRHLIGSTGLGVVNVDKLTYAGDPRTLAALAHDRRYRFVHADICDAQAMAAVFAQYRPRAVMHLAAESHVDRSIDGPAAFVQTNVVGTLVLLQAALDYWRGLDAAAARDFRFLHVSTDEVFGSLGAEGHFTEDSPYRPNSPYSASKAGADHLVRAWHHTYGLPTLITNCSNNYGPFQFPEKLMARMILNALSGKELPVYGDGGNVRDWLFVEDHAEALRLVLERGEPGGHYAIGGRAERSNLEVVTSLCASLDRHAPRADARPHATAIRFVTDRPGHDWRYAIDPAHIEAQLGFVARTGFDQGLERTVLWYRDHPDWWRPLLGRTATSAREEVRP